MANFWQIPCFILVLCLFYNDAQVSADLTDDIGLNITEYVPKYGYPIETHEVKTEDGYLLTFHRIPHGRFDNDSTVKKPVVFLMHGLLSTNIDWVNTGPGKGLGFLLADAGYDVWMGIQRGSTWNKRHLTLDPMRNASQFWDFSFHEIGVYDVASYIDHILNTTGVDSIYYVGHSQGNTAFYALMSTKPEYNKYIKLAVHLGPVAFLKNSKHPILKLLASKMTLINIAAKVAGIHELISHLPIFTELGRQLCVDGSEFQDICADVLYLFGGIDTDQMNKSIIPIIASNDPAGCSFKQIMHYLQDHVSGYFRQYDYGLLGNLKRYGKATPPQYNLTQVTAPVVLYSADKDLFCAPQDIDHLESLLPNVVSRKTVAFANFSHIDFLWAKDAVELVYNHVFELLKSV